MVRESDLGPLTSRRNRVVRMVVVIGLLTWLVAFIRAELLSGPNWLVDDLLVGGTVILLAAIVLRRFWKDSRG